MANRKQSKKGNMRTIAVSVCGLLLVLVVAFASVWCTGFALTGEADPFKWETVQAGSEADEDNNDKENVNLHTVALSSDGEALLEGLSYEMPTAFTFLSARSENSDTTEYATTGEITLTAGLSNEYINGEFDWSAKFNNPNSEWAQGKSVSDFVALEQPADGRQVKVKYLAPFSEQIIITATLRGSENSDTCTIDCLYKASSLEYYAGWHFTDYVCLHVEANFNEAGTVKGNFTLNSIYASIDESFQNKIKSFLNFDINFQPYFANGFEVIGEDNGFLMESNTEITPALFIEDYEDFDEEHKNAICFAWYSANKATNNSNNATYDFSINYNYKGAFVEKIEESEIGCCVNAIQYSDLAPSVTLNKNVVF